MDGLDLLDLVAMLSIPGAHIAMIVGPVALALELLECRLGDVVTRGIWYEHTALDYII